MKKHKYSVFSLALAIILGFALSTNATARSQTSDAVYFEICDISENERNCFTANMEGLAESVAMTFNVSSERIAFGEFYPIRGIDNMYYIPVFCMDECICVVTYMLRDDTVILNYSSSIAQYINSLPNGKYYFEKYDDSIYIVGTDTFYKIGEQNQIRREDGTFPVYSQGVDCGTMNIRGGLRYIEVEGQTRDVSSRSLDVPIYANGGNSGYGYCWLACCASIMEYYGTTPSSLSGIHAYKHSDHALEYCPGGDLDDVNDTLNYFAGKCGTKTLNRISAGSVQSEINAGKPIYSGWGHYSDAGIRDSAHGMVITGYTYVDNTRAFTYKIMDPNCSSYVYIYSNASSTQVTYLIGGSTYVWDKTLHNIN